MVSALTFPLPLDDFFAGLQITVLGFDLTENSRSVQTGGGEVLVSDLGPRLWAFDVEVNTRTHAEARKAEALGRALRQAGRSFFAFDPSAAYPSADRDGAILGASSPVIATLDADNRRMAISGLPGGYVLTRGDLLSFIYGSPARYALHEVLTEAVIADGSGVTPLFEVSPFIRSGAATGAAVTLVRPFCKAVMVPGSFRPGTRRAVLTSGFTFSARQTLR